jgi:hypothetical protein
VCDKLHCFSKEFYTTVLCEGGKSVLTMKETLWKNTLNFKKYAHMIYANFITTVMILSEGGGGGNRRHYFCNDLRPSTLSRGPSCNIIKMPCLSLSLSLSHTHTHTKSNVLKFQLGFTGENNFLIILMFVHFLFAIFQTNQLIYCIYDHNSGLNKTGF